MHVLIADDDPVCRGLLEEMLKTWGFTVTLAKDGQEALDALETGTPPDIAILDWMMPRLDGYEVCRALKQSDQQSIYVIMITGNSRKADLIKALVVGADDYLVKPLSGTDLQLHLRNAIRSIGLASENADLRNRLGLPVGG